MELQQPLTEGAAVSLSALGYRPDVPFAAMPKLEVRIGPHTWTVRDQGRVLPRSTAWGGAQDRRLVARAAPTKWTVRAVAAILQNPAYKGTYRFGAVGAGQ